MFKSQENCIKVTMAQIEKKHEERLQHHAHNFEYEVTKIHDVAKELHELFVEQDKKVKDFVNLKVTELKSEMMKEVEKIKKN